MTCTPLLEATPGFTLLCTDGAHTEMLLRTIGQRQFRTALDASHRQVSPKTAKKGLGIRQSKNTVLGRDLPLVITARADAFYGSATEIAAAGRFLRFANERP